MCHYAPMGYKSHFIISVQGENLIGLNGVQSELKRVMDKMIMSFFP